MDELFHDVRFALRRLLRRPFFAGVAVLSLALGIGANTAVFGLVEAILLRSPPFRQPQELLDVYRNSGGYEYGSISYPDYRDLVRQTGDIFRGVSATELSLVQTDQDDGVVTIPAELVSGNYFQLLGVGAERGRVLEPDDDGAPGANPVVALSHDFWVRSYGSDPEVVGTSIRLNGHAYTIVGVVDRDYPGNLRGLGPAVYAPISMVNQLNPGDEDQLQARGVQSIFARARLRPGTTTAQVGSLLDHLSQQLRREYPDTWQADTRFTFVPTEDVIVNPMVDRFIRPAAALMMTLVGLVLLVACTNLASFLLAQGADRRREIAVRLALGAGRGRLIRQLLTESVLLAALAGVLGTIVGIQGIRAFVATQGSHIFPVPLSLEIRPDATVLGFSVGVSGLAAVLFGLLPALQSTSPDVAPTLKGDSTGGGRPRRLRLRSALVVGQVAVSLALLTGAGLFLRSFLARSRVDPGFGHEPAALVTVVTPAQRYSEEEARVFFRTLLQQAEELPEVRAAGYTANLQLTATSSQMMSVYPRGVEPPPGQDYFLVDYAEVSPGFFQAAGIPIVRGRDFDDGDEAGSPRVAVVDQVFVDRFLDGGPALGRTFRRDERSYQVVGVARTTRVRSLGETPRPFVYTSDAQDFTRGRTLVARTRGDASLVVPKIVEVARSLDPQILVEETSTMRRHLAVPLAPYRLSALAVSVFGLAALLLAVIGLYGVVRYAVVARRREVGIRLSLGADPGRVVRMLTGDGLRLVAVGALLGLALAIPAARLVADLLFGVAPTDPLVLVAAPLVLCAVALPAAWLPARKAARIDPVRALKEE